MTKRHAYLIMAHNQFPLLEKLIQLLDDDRNDIYLHIDQKAMLFGAEAFKRIPVKSTLYLVPSINVHWGGYSQIECELSLLKEATKRDYRYLHLLSGVDLPLKSQDAIHDFFEKHDGTEFIHYADDSSMNPGIISRVSRYHLFQDLPLSEEHKVLEAGRFVLDKSYLQLQKLMRVNRLKQADFDLKFGANWFSITGDLAKYVVEREDWIEKHFAHSKCADELFLQTLVFQSAFKEKLSGRTKEEYMTCLRKIDWPRSIQKARPYIWREQDFEELVGSDYLFARKFDAQVDEKIIQRIYDYLSPRTAEKAVAIEEQPISGNPGWT